MCIRDRCMYVSYNIYRALDLFLGSLNYSLCYTASVLSDRIHAPSINVDQGWRFLLDLPYGLPVLFVYSLSPINRSDFSSLRIKIRNHCPVVVRNLFSDNNKSRYYFLCGYECWDVRYSLKTPKGGVIFYWELYEKREPITKVKKDTYIYIWEDHQ